MSENSWRAVEIKVYIDTDATNYSEDNDDRGVFTQLMQQRRHLVITCPPMGDKGLTDKELLKLIDKNLKNLAIEVNEPILNNVIDLKSEE